MMTVDTIFSQNLLAQNLLAQSQVAPVVRAGASPTEQRAAAVEFEQFFIAQMLDHMFSGIPTDGPFGGGNGESIFRSLLNNEYAKIIGRAGGIGIADVVQKEILRLQESETS